MKYSFCPTLLEKFEYLRTNGRTKAGVSAEAPAHYYNTYARGLFAQRLFEPIAWIMFGMGISHSTAGPIEKVFILISPRHVV